MTATKSALKTSKTSAAAKPRGSKKAVGRPDQTLALRVGRAIGRYRKLAGLTQAKVAGLLGIETETVSRLETGAISATLDRLEQFAELYCCPVASFFQEETEDAEGMARTMIGLLKPLTSDERRLMVNFVAEAGRLFRQVREKGAGH